MFDLRYHVASLAAVFVALMLGIVVGVGISDRGFLRGTERSLFEKEISNLRRQVDSLRSSRAADATERRAADALVRAAYPQLVGGRLQGKRIAVVFVGPVDGKVNGSVQQALQDAGAPGALRLRAIKVPVDPDTLDGELAGRPALAAYEGTGRLGSLGRELGHELVVGGETPLWDRLSGVLVEERSGTSGHAADGIVVARSASLQRGPTEQLLRGLYSGLADGGVPAVGVESSKSPWSAIAPFDRAGLSTVDSVDEPAGRAALVLLLAGGQSGNYGFGDTATAGVLPPVASVPEVATTGRG
jgi:Copper transport outer membrane protein, MctB